MWGARLSLIFHSRTARSYQEFLITMRGAHQAFFLDDDEKTRTVELLRRVEEFSIHFNRYYLSPLLEKGIIARTDPDHPQSPQQRYCLT